MYYTYDAIPSEGLKQIKAEFKSRQSSPLDPYKARKSVTPCIKPLHDMPYISVFAQERAITAMAGRGRNDYSANSKEKNM